MFIGNPQIYEGPHKYMKGQAINNKSCGFFFRVVSLLKTKSNCRTVGCKYEVPSLFLFVMVAVLALGHASRKLIKHQSQCWRIGGSTMLE